MSMLNDYMLNILFSVEIIKCDLFFFKDIFQKKIRKKKIEQFFLLDFKNKIQPKSPKFLQQMIYLKNKLISILFLYYLK